MTMYTQGLLMEREWPAESKEASPLRAIGEVRFIFLCAVSWISCPPPGTAPPLQHQWGSTGLFCRTSPLSQGGSPADFRVLTE